MVQYTLHVVNTHRQHGAVISTLCMVQMAGCCTHTHTQQDVVVQYTPVQFRWLVVTDSENGDRVSLLVMIAEVPEHSAWPAVSHGAVLVRSPTVDSYFH